MPGDDVASIKFFESLDCTEQAMFRELRQELIDIINTPNFNFELMLQKLEVFCKDADYFSPKKMLVCGICWLEDGIAINICQMKSYLPILKTTIHNHLQMMGYNSSKRDPKMTQEITDKIPFLNNEPIELRSWVVFKYIAKTPVVSFEPIRTDSPVSTSPEPIISQPSDSLYSVENVSKSMPTLTEIESFFDDPFSLPPIFLVEDSQKYIGDSQMIMV